MLLQAALDKILSYVVLLRTMTATAAENNRMVTFKLSEADHAELEMLAKVAERTLSAELRLAVRAWLSERRNT